MPFLDLQVTTHGIDVMGWLYVCGKRQGQVYAIKVMGGIYMERDVEGGKCEPHPPFSKVRPGVL